MEETLDTWLSRQMQLRGIRSIYRLSHEVGLDTGHVGDWLLGRAIPHEYEVGMIASFFGVPEQSVHAMSESMVNRNSREIRERWVPYYIQRRPRLPVPARR